MNQIRKSLYALLIVVAILAILPTSVFAQDDESAETATCPYVTSTGRIVEVPEGTLDPTTGNICTSNGWSVSGTMSPQASEEALVETVESEGGCMPVIDTFRPTVMSSSTIREEDTIDGQIVDFVGTSVHHLDLWIPGGPGSVSLVIEAKEELQESLRVVGFGQLREKREGGACVDFDVQQDVIDNYVPSRLLDGHTGVVFHVTVIYDGNFAESLEIQLVHNESNLNSTQLNAVRNIFIGRVTAADGETVLQVRELDPAEIRETATFSPMTVQTCALVGPNTNFNVREQAGEGYSIVAILPSGSAMTAIALQNGWFEISSPAQGFVAQSIVNVVGNCNLLETTARPTLVQPTPATSGQACSAATRLGPWNTPTQVTISGPAIINPWGSGWGDAQRAIVVPSGSTWVFNEVKGDAYTFTQCSDTELQRQAEASGLLVTPLSAVSSDLARQQ